MKTIEIDEVLHDFPAVCRAVASTGQAVVVTCDHEPLVSIMPLPRHDAGQKSRVARMTAQKGARDLFR